MTSFFALILLVLCPQQSAAQGNEVRVLETGPDMMVVELIISDYRMEALAGAGKKYLRLRAPGCGNTSRPGEPLLPVWGFPVGIPLEGTPQIRVLEEEWTLREVSSLCPVPTPRPDQGTELERRPANWSFSPDSQIYDRDAFYPTSLATAEPLGFFRDQRIGRVRLFPFHYNPVRGQLKVCRRLVVQVNFPSQAAATPPQAPPPKVYPAAEQVLSDMLLNYRQARSWRKDRTAEGLPRTMIQPEVSQRCKIIVSKDGLYVIGREELQQAGLDLDRIDPRSLQLSNKGKTVPIYAIGEKDGSFDEGDAIEFYGQANRETYLDQHEDMVQDPYSSENVYWLSWGAEQGARMVEEDGGIQDAGPRRPICFEFTVHAEEDNYRDHLNKQPLTCDHWFWDSGISAQQMVSYPLHLPHADRDSPLRPVVRVMLHGRTSSQEHEPDHHVLIYLNDHLAADRMWDGQNLLLIDSSQDGFELTSSAIQKGDNNLTLICPGDTDAGPIDRVLLNWIQVEYPRLYRAEDDLLEFSKPKNGPAELYQFTLQGFSSPSIWVYKLGTSVMVNGQGEWVQSEQGSYYQLTFQDEICDQQTRYLAITSAAKKRVESIELHSTPDLTAPGKGADLVIIVHQDFYENVLPLAQFRESQGLQVEVIQIDEIYAEFSHGLFTPEAIRDFLKYAHQNWDPSPLYVLLVGDGSWDYKDTMGLGGNYIPPIMTQTSLWGSTPCDNLYACISGDDQLPDLFLGRLPVKTNSELDAVIEKIIGAEETPELGDWRRRLLFVCGSGSLGPIFRSQSQRLIQDHVTPDFLLSKVYAYSPDPATDPYYGGSQDLIDALDEGAAYVSYIGHGGGGIWSDAGLMRLEDVGRLRNASRWPMVASMTCFTAAYDEPKRDCLGESLLLAQGKGVLGFWGSSGLGWLYGDYNLADALSETIFSGQRLTFGQALTEAKLQYMARYGGQIALDLINEYLLLGDPVSRISFPDKKISLSVQPGAVNPGDTLEIQGTTGEGDQGQAQLTILDGAGISRWQSSVTVTDGHFQAKVGLSPDCSTGTGTVRCYFWDSQNLTDGTGAASFSLGQAFFDTIFTDPAQPTAEDTVHVWAEIYATCGIDSVRCRWIAGFLDSTNLMVSQPPGQLYRTSKPLPIFGAGTNVRYRIIVQDSCAESSSSSQHSYRIPSAADLHISSSGIALAGEQETGIAVEVENLGQTQADSVLVRVTVTPTDDKLSVQEGLIEQLPAGSRASLFLLWDLAPGSYQVLAEADPEDNIREGNENNNAAGAQIDMNRCNVTPQEGTVVQGQHAPAFSLDGNLGCDIPGGTVSHRQVLSIQPASLQFQGQPDLQPARLATGEQLAYNLTFLDSSASICDSSQILLTFRLDGQDSLNISGRDNLAIYRWNPVIQRWIRHAQITWPAPDSISAIISGLGLFCPVINGDQTPPSIEITVEEQHFAEGGLVSTTAKIVAMIQDINGVDSVERPVEVWHNGQVLDAQQIVLYPAADRNSLPVSYTSMLATGRHTVAFSAYDCNGNFASKTVDFQVIGSYGIDRIGNYPNPFDEETVFTYRLTGPTHAREISLKIYTVCGRLVKSFHDFIDDFGRPGTQLDYHVKTWDGRDKEGTRLANGVYFYKIRAKWENQTVHKTGKLAILK